MSLTLQKADIWKRISAFLFDIILTFTLAVGVSMVVSALLGFSGQQSKLEERYTVYEQQFGVQFNISEEEYEKLTEEQKIEREALIEQASEALSQDTEYIRLSNLLFYMTLIILAVGAFIAILTWQFLLPLLFGNGQTLGKKIFGLAVIRTNLTKAANPVLFIRAMIGCYAIETMFPLLMLVMITFGLLGLVGVITLLLFLGLQLYVMISSKTNSAIHDLLCDTAVVDLTSQMVFETEEARLVFEQQANESEQQNVLNSSN